LIVCADNEPDDANFNLRLRTSSSLFTSEVQEEDGGSTPEGVASKKFTWRGVVPQHTMPFIEELVQSVTLTNIDEIRVCSTHHQSTLVYRPWLLVVMVLVLVLVLVVQTPTDTQVSLASLWHNCRNCKNKLNLRNATSNNTARLAVSKSPRSSANSSRVLLCRPMTGARSLRCLEVRSGNSCLAKRSAMKPTHSSI
jgi:hypothetical protein